ncbi:MAG: GHKL domain-containing protein [Calditrichaeota bacterium]|nr:GHKL domain-containing protein [Calditrichota bacterium]
MIKSFKGKLLFWTGLTFIITLLFINLLVYFSLKSYLFNKIDSRIEEECGEIAEVVRFTEGKILIIDSTEWREAEHTEFGEHSLYLQIESPDGRVIRRSENLHKKEIFLPLEGKSERKLTFHEHQYQQNVFRIGQFQKAEQTPVILTAYEISDTVNFLATVRLAFIIISPLILIIALVGIAFITSKAFSPIQRITQIAQNIFNSGNLQQKITADVRDEEIGTLIGTLNALFQKLDTSINQVKNFSADASHELRTPLTIIRGQIEVLLKRERTKEEYKKLLFSVHEEVLKMTRIINNLFQLARADNGKFSMEMKLIRIDELAMDFESKAKSMAREKSIVYKSHIKPNIEILGNKDALQEIFINIMDNAVKYNKPKGTIEFILDSDEKNVILEFRDSGIGIAEDERDKIFERFYRVDKTRSRKQGGSGLGLAIVKWIVNEHNGTIHLESKMNEGTTFRVFLPRVEFEL